MLPVVKIQHDGHIQDGVENVYIFHPIFSKMIILSIFLTFGINKTFLVKLFLENSKWWNNLV
jgi:hypothetical protein